MKWAVFFQKYENCIFTRGQAVDLLARIGVDDPAERYKYFKKKYGLETFTYDDIIFVIFEIRRARDIFFAGGLNYPAQKDIEMKTNPINKVV